MYRSNAETRGTVVRVAPSPSLPPSFLPARLDGDDPTPDNWILFPAKKPGRSVADDECNPVRFPRTQTLALFSRTRVSRSLPLPYIFLPFLSAPYLPYSPPSISLSLFPVPFAFFCVPRGSFPIARRVEFPQFVLLYVATRKREEEREREKEKNTSTVRKTGIEK